ncbi:MCE family protein [Jatrophihabitans sp.]|uniref:MCE family protein n=1 Tax=Jatrophihabitans sp. TaxID=1932789 RepID=UPI0030C7604B|nr:Secreted protein [Jatrophihabitans sp.]
METIHNKTLETILGLLLALGMIAGIVVVWESFQGRFGDEIKVTAQLSQAGDALEQGDIVTYRDIIVGEVTSTSGDLAGGAAVQLKIKRSEARVIPGDVTAVALPASLFGNTRIELVPTRTLAGAPLHNGSHLAADRTPAAESLQTALANAYSLLTSIHPAELDAALSSLATALQGQGASLGKLISQADGYLRTIAPHLPQLDSLITNLATVTDHLAKDSPALLSGLSDTLVVAKGILAEKQAIANLLAIAPTSVENAQLLLSPQNITHAVTIFRDEEPVLGALGADPDSLARTIAGFKAFADTLGAAMSSGPYLKANIILTGANFAALVNTAVGMKGTVFDSIADPKEYTAANCPRYPGSDGPNCTAAAGKDGANAKLITTGDSWGGQVASVGSKQEIFAVKAAASSLSGVPAAQIPDGVDLLLGPLLRGSATVIK